MKGENIQKKGDIKTENIIQSGVALKSAVSTIMLMILFVFIGSLIVFNTSSLVTIRATSIILGIVVFFCNIRVLMKFYEAGDKLENVKLKKEEESNSDHENAETSNFVQYHTDKGILEIPPCINFKGQRAFLNGESAPDGKYKYSFLSYFHIKDGVIIKG